MMRLHVEKIDHTAPPKHVARLGLSNKTPMSRTIGILGFECELCGLAFEKPAAWAKRVSHHYCSVSCANEGRKVRIHTNCTVCNADMEQTLSGAVRVVTCSKFCSSKRRQSDTPNARGFKSYKEEMMRLARRGVCSQCGVRHGPWVVRGIASTFRDAVLTVDKSSGSLWCRPCHFLVLSEDGLRAQNKIKGEK